MVRGKVTSLRLRNKVKGEGGEDVQWMESNQEPITYKAGSEYMLQLLALKNSIWEVVMATDRGFLTESKSPLSSVHTSVS